MTARRIVTSRIDGPGCSAWRAWDDDLGADASPMGQGSTEAEAITDLEMLFDEMGEEE